MEKVSLAIACIALGLVLGFGVGSHGSNSGANFQCTNNGGASAPVSSGKFGSGTETATFGGLINGSNMTQSSNTTTFLNSNGTIVSAGRGTTTSTIDFSAGKTCFEVTAINGTVYSYIPNPTTLFGWTTSTSPCAP